MLLAEPLTDRVIGLAIEVHRHTGPGLLESVYELCLCRELADAGIAFARQVVIPVLYKGAEVGDGFKADIVVAGELILEIKAVSTTLPIHTAQLRTGSGWPGLTLPDAHILFRNRMRRSLRAAHRVVFESNFEPLEVLGGEACTIPLRKHMPATN